MASNACEGFDWRIAIPTEKVHLNHCPTQFRPRDPLGRAVNIAAGQGGGSSYRTTFSSRYNFFGPSRDLNDRSTASRMVILIRNAK
jgi:hypothetical protein